MAKETNKEVCSLLLANRTEGESAAARPNEIQSLWCITQDVAKITVWVFCILWHVLIGSIFLGIEISGSAIVFIACFVLASIVFLISVFAGIGVLEDKRVEKPNGSTIFQKYNSFKLILMRGWGILFRTLFISLICIAGYYWIDPQPIGGTPFPDLTLRQFFSNLFAFLLVLGCIVWFLKFPKNKNPMSEDTSSYPYLVWGWFGLLLISLAIVVVAYGGMLLTNL